MWIPARSELKAVLDTAIRTSTRICINSEGKPWKNEKTLQRACGDVLRRFVRKGLVGKGLTLHGLRVTYADEIGANGASDKEVAAAFGDRSESMGAHYTRNVKKKTNVIRAFDRLKKNKE